MSVENTTTKVVYAGNGVTKEWPVPFQYARSEDIALLIDDGTTQTDITSNYKIVVNESGDTSVTYPVSGTAVAAGNKLAIYRLTPRTQVVDLVYGGAFAPDVLENDGLDRIVMMTQELSRDVERAVKLAITSEDSPDALVASIYASRDAAAASASVASAQATAAEASAQAASGKADESAASAAASAQSAANAYAASEGMAPRMDAVEAKNAQQDVRLDGVESSTTAINSALSGKANLAMDNLTQAGTTVISHYVKPSNRRVNMALPSVNGGATTMPGDGTLQIMFYGANAFVAINNNTTSIQEAATTTFNSSVNATSLTMPVSKNDSVAVWWGGTSITITSLTFNFDRGAY